MTDNDRFWNARGMSDGEMYYVCDSCGMKHKNNYGYELYAKGYSYNISSRRGLCSGCFNKRKEKIEKLIEEIRQL